eukprot:3531952-Prorocentrum_lima.AAC.1
MDGESNHPSNGGTGTNKKMEQDTHSTKGSTFVNWNTTMRRINKGSRVRKLIVARPVITGYKDEVPTSEIRGPGTTRSLSLIHI